MSLRSSDVLLITGATGFVGRTISRSAAGYGFSRVLTPGRQWGEVPWSEVTHVAHCAAVIPARVKATGADPAAYATNPELTADLLEHLGQSPLRALALLSSVSVYRHDVVDLGEHAPQEDEEPYALSKIQSEGLVRSAAEQRGFAAWILRASSVYGQGMDQALLLPAMCRAAMAGGPITLYGPRHYTQNFVHVEDLANVVLTALAGPGNAGEAIAVNAFSDDTWELAALAEVISEQLSPPGLPAAILDRTAEPPAPSRVFPNDLLKGLLPVEFRRLEVNLRDVTT